ncbi:hypothetical protein LC092_00025 [Stappia stellulata]|uniref:hypothetical protein n=1 Tax=Stappia TaxID=152161 RepID=UPI001CD4C3A5|nr:hypothetical protein [Stappia stellulata]MCA1240813.1 hypothetical protein [Stappia stellulata]
MRNLFYISANFRRFFSGFVAVAFLMVSIGVGHTMPAPEAYDRPLEVISFIEASCDAGLSQPADCAESAAQQDQGHPAKNAAFGNCCVISCSPTVVVAATAEAVVIDFSVVRLFVPVDVFAGSNAPDGLFRPPRARA